MVRAARARDGHVVNTYGFTMISLASLRLCRTRLGPTDKTVSVYPRYPRLAIPPCDPATRPTREPRPDGGDPGPFQRGQGQRSPLLPYIVRRAASPGCVLHLSLRWAEPLVRDRAPYE